MMHFEVLVEDLEAAVERVLRCGGAQARINQMIATERGSG